jgi:valyl-tRNA synthetase
MIETTFDPQSVERRWIEAWERSGAFKPRAGADEAFSIAIPPPNVTGSLHMGHALNNTLQDVLARFERLRGKSVLWQPGLDHAGIATQLVVERQLAAEGSNQDRKSLGREAFVARVWEWKGESGGAILNQLRRLGCSADWSRERFTMDEGLSHAVRRVFVQLYQEGLIYKDKRLVNWDPRLETAVSDLEVEDIEIKGHLWHIRYPLADDPARFIVVATTRPETMLGDTAVAVHPGDERYADLVGRRVTLPLSGREVPIIADDYANPEKGSGGVKITPAHDFNDFEVGKRHGLPLIDIFDERAVVNANAPAKYRGLERFAARKAVVADLEALELIEKIEPIVHAVPHDEKSKSVILEPRLTEQWYCNVRPLADAAMAAVRAGRTRFLTEQGEREFFRWMENIQPWCISRQLWWGHQIPVWYGPDGALFCKESEAEARAAARAHYKRDVALTRDEDVLDTWFSSALWPFSTLGWPGETPELARFYPTSVLITGTDILFFWVARMLMMGLKFAGDVPFREVYLHTLVRDAKGQKMSKTRGNVIDPLTLVDRYGADALRLTMAMISGQHSIKLAEKIVEGHRNFGTKLWNAARFAQMNEAAPWETFDPTGAKEVVNRWIIGETVKLAQRVTEELEARRFHEAAGALYRFIWNVLCDWYLELVKPLLGGEDEDAKIETRRTMAWVLDRTITLLHPFMPFITEELWARLAEFGVKRERLLIEERWPDLPASLIDGAAEAEIDWVIGLITETRATRSALNVPPSTQIQLYLVGAARDLGARLDRHAKLIDRLARLEFSTTADSAPPGSVTFVMDDATVALPLDGVIDFKVEAERLAKEIARHDSDAAKIAAKLDNADFVRKAPEDVVEENRERLAEALAARDKLAAAHERLAALLD